MPIVPIRDLSKFGVITDVDPFNLPPQAFSMAVNARFTNGSIQRGPVWRNVLALNASTPRFMVTHLPSTGNDAPIIGYLNGRVYKVASGAETNISIASYSNTNSDTPFTSTVLADVLYVNREDRVPWSYASGDSIMHALSNWDSGWRAKLLRSCGGALVALNVTKSSTAYPTMVKTSEFALSGNVPSTWDETDPTNNATENVLSEMKGAIKDASSLGETLCIYGTNETWFMTPDNSNDVFDYRRAPFKGGAISANCSVEVDGRQYVFGLNDIWRHDGVTKESISDGRVRKFVFRNLNVSKAQRCFVKHNEFLNQISFYYVSNDPYAGFNPLTAEGCNRAAVFDLTNETWTFDDTPYVFGADMASASSSALTYATTVLTYDTASTTYADEDDQSKKVLLVVGGAYASETQQLYAFDLEGADALVPIPANTTATQGITLIRDGIDMDELDAELRGYKLVMSVYPQGRLADGAEPLTFEFGVSDGFNLPVTYGSSQTYDGGDLYKLDFNQAGRYLAMRITHDDYHYFSLTGFDLDLMIIADR